MKKITCVLEIGSNYAFHLAALARAGFESEYASDYEKSLGASDLNTLLAHRDRLNFAFGQGRGGDLAGLLIFQPGYLNLDSKELYEEYFGLLDHAFESDNYSTFLKRFPGPENWVFNMDELYLSQFKGSRDVFRALGEVYTRGIQTYLSSLWSEECRKMEHVLSELNQHFSSQDIIGRWEDVTGIPFKYDTYTIVLCGALKNGPTANSLGYEKNTFFYGHDREWMKDFMSHEVGTHILIDIMREMYSSQARAYPASPYLLYRAYENLARFYNSMVLGKDGLYQIGKNYHCDEFRDIYQEIYSQNSSITPRELFAKGVTLFVREHPDLT